ncbi:MAG: hypothetical protein EXR77_20300 [Myxococcales bacterium]|nr:hypothetical protein [Myxococcales bacterium]
MDVVARVEVQPTIDRPPLDAVDSKDNLDVATLLDATSIATAAKCPLAATQVPFMQCSAVASWGQNKGLVVTPSAILVGDGRSKVFPANLDHSTDAYHFYQLARPDLKLQFFQELWFPDGQRGAFTAIGGSGFAAMNGLLSAPEKWNPKSLAFCAWAGGLAAPSCVTATMGDTEPTFASFRYNIAGELFVIGNHGGTTSAWGEWKATITPKLVLSGPFIKYPLPDGFVPHEPAPTDADGSFILVGFDDLFSPNAKSMVALMATASTVKWLKHANMAPWKTYTGNLKSVVGLPTLGVVLLWEEIGWLPEGSPKYLAVLMLDYMSGTKLGVVLLPSLGDQYLDTPILASLDVVAFWSTIGQFSKNWLAELFPNQPPGPAGRITFLSKSGFVIGQKTIETGPFGGNLSAIVHDPPTNTIWWRSNVFKPDNTCDSYLGSADIWGNFSCATSGPCWQKAYADCVDTNPCTSDLCDADHAGCYHVPLPDGITCATGKACQAGACQ